MAINKKDFVKTIQKNVSGKYMMPDGHMMSNKEMEMKKKSKKKMTY